jgi:hypothetical protein
MSFFKKHQKKILAVFSVGLMVAFAAESGTGGGGGSRTDPVVGKMNGAPVHASELEQASQEWRAMQRYHLGPIIYEILAVPTPDAQMDGSTWHQSLQQARLIENEIDNNGDLFFLLAREARNAGVRPDTELLQAILTHVAPMLPQDDDQTYSVVRAGLTDLLLIRANFEQVASNVKVSQPLAQRLLATQAQTITLNVVPLPLTDFSHKTPAPTTQQVQAQFEKFSNVDPGVSDLKSNPFGFGYRLPERVKLQYFEISRDAAEKIVQARKTPYDWDVAAHLYYYQHPEDFATTEPSSTQPVASSTTAPTSAPSAKPFDQVHAEALQHVQGPLVDKLVADVQNKITSSLQTDWQLYTRNTSRPSSSATSGPSAPSFRENYPSYTYLRQLADAVQAQFGLKVDVNEESRDYLSAKDLAALPGIGEASDNPSSANGRDFAAIAMQQADAYLKQTDKNTPTARANLMKPSVPLEDGSHNIYIFRLTDARPAEPPPSAKDVAGQIDADLRTAGEYKLAKDAAQQLLSSAQTGTLASAAMATGRSVIATEPLSGNSFFIAAGLSLTPQATQSFINQAQQLLSHYDPKTNAHPMELIEIPSDGKIFVAQLSHISAKWTDQNFFATSLLAAAQVRSQLLLALQGNWFANAAVVQRAGYTPAANSKDAG